jgi:alanine racemase
MSPKAELIGPGQTADELAAHAGTINYEIVTGLSARVERRLVD